MVASTLATEKSDRSSALLAEANVEDVDRPGSEKYQQNHMALIFQEGFSFSGFERNKVFLGGPDGRFQDLSDISGADSDLDGRASCVADFDDDGDPDLFINTIQREAHLLYRNDVGGSSGNGFLKLRLRATGGEPEAIGAVVEVECGGRTHCQVLSSGSGFVSQNASELIFGLGAAESARVFVRWPGRERESFGELARNGRFRLVEGGGAESVTARPFAFRDPGVPGLRVRVGEVLDPIVAEKLTGGAQPIGFATAPKTLLNFWTTTCASCVKEMPLLQSLHEQKDYRVVGVSLDPISLRDKVARFQKDRKLTFEMLILSEEAADRYFDLERLAIPVSMIVDREGRIERILQGQLHEGDL